MVEQVKQSIHRLPKKHLGKIIIFIVVFGLFVAGLSALISEYFNPADNPVVDAFLTQSNWVLVAYFAYVMIASVIVPIPTLPIDIILLKVADPASVIIIRLAAGLAGGSVSFYLARNFGRKLLRRWFSKKNYDFVEEISTNITWQQFFIITMIPVINAELMAYAGGISKLRFRLTLAVLTLAIFYRLLFVYFVLKV